MSLSKRSLLFVNEGDGFQACYNHIPYSTMLQFWQVTNHNREISFLQAEKYQKGFRVTVISNLISNVIRWFVNKHSYQGVKNYCK